MELVALFPYNANIEIIMNDLQKRGYTPNSAMIVPLRDPVATPPNISAIGTGGSTNWDLAFVVGTIGMLLGSIYGFVFPGGPVLWALGALLFSFGAGACIDWLVRIRKHRQRRIRSALVLWIRCEESEGTRLKAWLAEFGAEGIGEIGGAQPFAITADG